MLPGLRRILWTPASIASRARWKWKCTSATIGTVHLRQDLLQGGGVLLLRDRDADDVRAGGGELVDLGDALVDFVRVAGGHRLDGDRRVAADGDEAVGGVADVTLRSGTRTIILSAPSAGIPGKWCSRRKLGFAREGDMVAEATVPLQAIQSVGS